MSISERLLRKWRKEALKHEGVIVEAHAISAPILVAGYIECQQRILQMTQELLDQHLLRK